MWDGVVRISGEVDVSKAREVRNNTIWGLGMGKKKIIKASHLNASYDRPTL